MRGWGLAAVAAAVAICLPLSSWAQPAGEVYPARPIRLVNFLSAGSAGDRLARLYADALSPQLRQKVIVDNRPGDGGNIAAQTVARAPADGYTLLFGSTASLAIQMTYGAGTLNYDLRRDFAPVSTVAQIPNGFFVTPVFAGDTLQVLVKEAKAQPALGGQSLKEGVEPGGSAPQGLREQIEREINKWARVIRNANIGRE